MVIQQQRYLFMSYRLYVTPNDLQILCTIVLCNTHSQEYLLSRYRECKVYIFVTFLKMKSAVQYTYRFSRSLQYTILNPISYYQTNRESWHSRILTFIVVRNSFVFISTIKKENTGTKRGWKWNVRIWTNYTKKCTHIYRS